MALEDSPTLYAHKAMTKALEALKEEQKNGKASRENSLAVTNLQQAMMWNNNDRTIKGELKPYDTHVTG